MTTIYVDSRTRVAGLDSDFEVDLGKSLHLQSDARLAVYKIRIADSFLSTDRVNVLPRPGQPQPPPQIIGRPSDVERLLDEAGQRWSAAQRKLLRRRRPWLRRRVRLPLPPRAWAESSGTWGPGRGGCCPGARRGQGCWNAGWRGGSWRGGNGCGRRSLRPRARHGLGAGEHALPAPARQRGRGRAGRPVRQQHERRHSAAALHAAHRQQPRLLSVWLPCSGAVQPHAAPRGLNRVALPQSQPRASSSSGQSRRSLPPPSFDQLARDIGCLKKIKTPLEREFILQLV